jgi:tetratricopeptide (TPR) repeat protein
MTKSTERVLIGAAVSTALAWIGIAVVLRSALRAPAPPAAPAARHDTHRLAARASDDADSADATAAAPEEQRARAADGLRRRAASPRHLDDHARQCAQAPTGAATTVAARVAGGATSSGTAAGTGTVAITPPVAAGDASAAADAAPGALPANGDGGAAPGDALAQLLQHGARSNDVIICVDGSLAGEPAQDNVVQLDPAQLTSDLLDHTYSNAAGVWLVGCDGAALASLERLYGERLVAIPGFGSCLLCQSAAGDDAQRMSAQIVVLQAALAVQPQAQLYAALSKAYAGRGDLNQALATIDAGAAQAPAGFDWDVYRGNAYLANSARAQDAATRKLLLQQAVAAYQHQIDRGTDQRLTAYAALDLARAQSLLGARDRAIGALESAYATRVFDFDQWLQQRAVLQLGDHYMAQDDYPAALRWYERATPCYDLYMCQAQACEKLGDRTTAALRYQRAADAAPRRVDPLLQLGVNELARGDTAAAQRAYQRATAVMTTLSARERQQAMCKPCYRQLTAALANP